MINNLRSTTAILLLLISCLNSKAESIQVSDEVSGIWNVDTVLVMNNITLRESTTLEITPGVVVLFTDSYYFKVKGSLTATGSQDQPIRFTIADTTGFYNDSIPDGGWKNIRIENINPLVDSIIFRYCNFEFGKATYADSIHGYGGAICIRNSDKVVIENCVFKNNHAFFNGGAVYLENASIAVSNNLFEQNSCGQVFAYYGYGGELCTDWGEPVIYRNTFYQNSSTGIGGGLCVRLKDCMVTHNIFDDNFSALGGGFGILHIPICNFVISNNLIVNNGATFFGAGISNNNSNPIYVNNTIANNHCTGGGGGFYCKDSVVPVLQNNILYGNTQYGGEINQVYLWDLLSQPNFYYNNIEGGTAAFAGTGGSAYSGAYQNNLDEALIFEPRTFELNSQSPCVNSGNPDTSGLMIPATDLAGNTRLVWDRIDMGAYESQKPLGIFFHESTSGVLFHQPGPNPASDVVNISVSLPQAQLLSLTLMNSQGMKVYDFFSGNLGEGTHNFTLDVENQQLSNGMYFCVMNLAKEKITRKIMIQN